VFRLVLSFLLLVLFAWISFAIPMLLLRPWSRRLGKKHGDSIWARLQRELSEQIDGEILADSKKPSEFEKLAHSVDEVFMSIRDHYPTLKSRRVKKSIHQIENTVVEIMKRLYSKPTALPGAKGFILHTLSAVKTMVAKYDDLEELSPTQRLESSLIRVESTLDRLVDAMEKHHNSLLDNDLIELDAEIKVLEQNIRTEGY